MENNQKSYLPRLRNQYISTKRDWKAQGIQIRNDILLEKYVRCYFSDLGTESERKPKLVPELEKLLGLGE